MHPLRPSTKISPPSMYLSPRGRQAHISPLFFFNDTATTEIYTLSLHDALPICPPPCLAVVNVASRCAHLQPRGTLPVPTSPGGYGAGGSTANWAFIQPSNGLSRDG